MSDASKLCPVCTQSWSAADHTPCFTPRLQGLTDAEIDTINFALGVYLGDFQDGKLDAGAVSLLGRIFGADIITDEVTIRRLADRFRRGE